MSSDKVYSAAQVGLKHEPLDEVCGGPSKPVSMDMSRVLSHQTAVNVTGKTTRSASDPVTRKLKEERPLSAPSISNLREYEKYEDFANAMPAKSFSKAAKSLGQEYSGMIIGNVEHDKSLATQKKGVKNKMKILTQKLMEKLKDKRDFEHTGSKNTQDSVEEEEGQNVCLLPHTSNEWRKSMLWLIINFFSSYLTITLFIGLFFKPKSQWIPLQLNSMEVEAEAQDIPPLLPPKMGKYVFLDRWDILNI